LLINASRKKKKKNKKQKKKNEAATFSLLATAQKARSKIQKTVCDLSDWPSQALTSDLRLTEMNRLSLAQSPLATRCIQQPFELDTSQTDWERMARIFCFFFFFRSPT
jgi:hypothetical protein